MDKKPYVAKNLESTAGSSPSQDMATILSQLPRNGAEDDVTRLMEIYEAGERSYRASVQASAPNVSSSASTSL
jgi:hypothetical protein